MKSSIAIYRVRSLPRSLWRNNCCGDSRATDGLLPVLYFFANDLHGTGRAQCDRM